MTKYLLSLGFCTAIFLSCKTSKTTQDITTPGFDIEGHRGCRGLMPENTVPAMLKAIDLGVTTLEMDIVFTEDNVAVLSHEPFFNHEITTTPSGKFIEQKDEKTYNIYQMSFKETQQYDVGIKPNARFTNQEKRKATKPALSELIDSVEKYLSIRKLPKVLYNIETKTNPSTDNTFHPAPAEFVKRLMEVIESKHIEDRVIIQSFDFRTLRIIHKDYPSIKTAMLIEAYDKRSLEEQLDNLGFIPTIYSPEHSLVKKQLIDSCHSKNIKVIPWTVNDKVKIDTLKKLGVDGIITDYPNLFNE